MLDIGAAILERGRIEQTWGMQGRDLMSERNAPEDVLTQHAHQAKMDGLGVCPYVHSLRDPRYRLAVSLKASGMPTLSSMTASTRGRFLDARLQISGRSPHIRAAIGPQENPTFRRALCHGLGVHLRATRWGYFRSCAQRSTRGSFVESFDHP